MMQRGRGRRPQSGVMSQGRTRVVPSYLLSPVTKPSTKQAAKAAEDPAQKKKQRVCRIDWSTGSKLVRDEGALENSELPRYGP